MYTFIEDLYTVKSYCIFKEIHVISDTESTLDLGILL